MICTGEWRRLHNEELNDLYCSPNIVRVIKWRRRRWMEHVARMGHRRGAYRFWWGDLRERGHVEDLGVVGRIIDVGWETWIGSIWLGIETGGGRL